MRANAFGSAPAAAIESEVREPGRIVVCAEEIPETITATTSRPSGPSTCVAATARTPALSSNFSTRSRPAKAISATATST